jgi:NO-binding membrane sensor protein with MHYT domain
MFLITALLAVHWTMYSGVVLGATMSYNVGIIIAAIVVGFVLCGFATHLFFHFRTSRMTPSYHDSHPSHLNM